MKRDLPLWTMLAMVGIWTVGIGLAVELSLRIMK